MTAIETPTTTVSDETEQAPEAMAEQTAERIFEWSAWVHVGDGAAECADRFTGRCKEEEHFHAWCRLANPHQIRDITEKAAATRARYLRTMRDENSDQRVILESELDLLRDAPTELLVGEIIDRDFAEDYVAAQREVDAMEDPDYVVQDDEEIPRLYAGIDQDREEYQRQRLLSEEQRSGEFERLEQRLADYGNAIEAEMLRIQEPRRAALAERDREGLIDLIRKDRIEAKAREVHIHTYNIWQWYVCTYKPRSKGTPNERVWGDINHMKNDADTPVVLAIKETFERLERKLAETRLGKGF